MAIDRIDELLAEGYLADLASLPLAEVRQRRDACQEAADQLSYLRRLVQGRLDIVHADLHRRAGGEPGDLAAIVDQLKRGEILSERGGRPAGPGRLPMTLGPADDDGWISAELDAIVGPGGLGDLPGRGDDEVQGVADALAALERRVSDQRAQLHERTNVFQEEIVRRYKSGEATVEALLQR
jgi:hypothetical protein